MPPAPCTIGSSINAAICYLAPPITVVFVAGVFWKKASSKASIVTLITGTILGFVVFLLDFLDVSWWNVLFMMAGFYLACFCSIIMILVSTFFPDSPTRDQIALVWNSPLEPLREKGISGAGNYKIISLVLACVMIVLYILFTFYIV